MAHSFLAFVSLLLVAVAWAAPQEDATPKPLQPQLIGPPPFARLRGVYLQPARRIPLQPIQRYTPAPQLEYTPAPLPVYRQPSGVPGARIAAILRQNQDIGLDGSYTFGFESEDGIIVQANAGPLTAVGPEEGVQTVTGSFSYTAPDGTPITTNWIADENGFRAEGAHLPRGPEANIRPA